jgi:hypothetical protein
MPCLQYVKGIQGRKWCLTANARGVAATGGFSLAVGKRRAIRNRGRRFQQTLVARRMAASAGASALVPLTEKAPPYCNERGA